MEFAEQLKALEASHVQLMTQHKVFVREQEKSWDENRAAWAEHRAWLKEYDARCAQDRIDRLALDKRIADLVSGIGEFMRREKG
jgi:hypothetical protein